MLSLRVWKTVSRGALSQTRNRETIPGQMVAAQDTGISNKYRFLKVNDLTANRLFLVDTYDDANVGLRCPNNLAATQAKTLQAANDTDVHTYEHRSPTRHLGLNFTFGWVFIIPEVAYPTTGKELYQDFDRLVDNGRRKILDRQTSLKVPGWYAVVSGHTSMR